MPEKTDPVMVNVTHMDRERYFEAVRARGRNGRSVVLSVGGLAAAVIGLFMSSPWITLLGLVICVLAILSPGIIGRRDYRKLCERYPGGTWVKTIRFYADHLESDAGGGYVTSAPYTGVRHEYEYGRMYVLDFGKTHPAAAFDKSGFVTGSLAELKTLLVEARRAEYAPPDGREEDVDQQGRPCERNFFEGEDR